MEDAGFVLIEFGLETGSPRMLESTHKGITQSDVLTLVETLKPFKKFKVHFLVMCGFPGETDETVRESVEFIQTILREYYVRITTIGVLEIFPGSEVYEIAKAAGAIGDDYWLTDKRVPYYTVDHDIQKLREYADYILDRTSIFRVFTSNGFRHQFLKMPLQVLTALVRDPGVIPLVAAISIKCHSPRLYAIIRQGYERFFRRLSVGKAA